jgi:hypothetical protein
MNDWFLGRGSSLLSGFCRRVGASVASQVDDALRKRDLDLRGSEALVDE